MAENTTTGGKTLRIFIPDEIAELAPDIQRFFDSMVYKLRRNKHKGRWPDLDAAKTLQLLRGETKELEEALSEGNVAEITMEAADIANFALIIANISLDAKNALWRGETQISAHFPEGAIPKEKSEDPYDLYVMPDGTVYRIPYGMFSPHEMGNLTEEMIQRKVDHGELKPHREIAPDLEFRSSKYRRLDNIVPPPGYGNVGIAKKLSGDMAVTTKYEKCGMGKDGSCHLPDCQQRCPDV